MLKQVRTFLNKYCDRVEADALRAGLKRAPKKRGEQHFDWLVRYQIKGESFASIAKDPAYRVRGRQTVQKAVTELAEYLGVALRRSLNVESPKVDA